MSALLDDHRADWHARPPTSPLTAIPLSAWVGLVWHWAGPPTHLFGKPHNACLLMVRAWQIFHQGPSRGWKDIGYNVLICPHARAIEGRGIGVSASHSPSWNHSRIGVQFMVGEGEKVTPAMFARGVQLQRDIEALAKHDLSDACHHDDPAVSTECCGPQVTAWVRAGGPDPATPAVSPTPRPLPAPPMEGPSMFLVKIKGTDPLYKSDGFRRIHVTPAERDALVAGGVKVVEVKNGKALAAYGPEVTP